MAVVVEGGGEGKDTGGGGGGGEGESVTLISGEAQVGGGDMATAEEKTEATEWEEDGGAGGGGLAGSTTSTGDTAPAEDAADRRGLSRLIMASIEQFALFLLSLFS